MSATPDTDVDVDGCVVNAAPLCGLLLEFVDGWRRERPAAKKNKYVGEYGPSEDISISPYTFLALDGGLAASYARSAGRDEPNAADIARAETAIRNVKRQRTVELRVADSLVSSGIGNPGMFHPVEDPVLRVMPNPKASPERRAECCKGSTPDSLVG